MTLNKGNKVSLPSLRNLQNHLYDKIVISLTLYYDFAVRN
jgi:hypothetical protein